MYRCNLVDRKRKSVPLNPQRETTDQSEGGKEEEGEKESRKQKTQRQIPLPQKSESVWKNKGIKDDTLHKG